MIETTPPAEPRPAREPTVADVFALQPGLARLMPEIGARFWKCWYAADARNWELARWQLKEMKKLFRLGNMTRPKYALDVNAYLEVELQPVVDAIDRADFAGFDAAFRQAVGGANEYHAKWNKPYITWKLPAVPPPDLDLTPNQDQV